jgi:hypothetical protein
LYCAVVCSVLQCVFDLCDVFTLIKLQEVGRVLFASTAVPCLLTLLHGEKMKQLIFE